MITVSTDIRQWIEERLLEAPQPGYKYPLAYQTWGVEEIYAALECLCDQRTTMWDKTRAFEDQFARYLGTPDEAVMVNSGSSADLVMMLAAREMGLLRPGDEILIPAVTWPTQVWAAIQAGFKVRLVDVEVSTLNTSLDILEAAITPKTKAIFLVHLMGNPCKMNMISRLAAKRGILLFEDCCEALGAEFDGRKVGTFGTAGAFSFFASHQMSTMEGGMIVSANRDFTEQCRLLRAHGWSRDLRRQVPANDCADPRYHFVGMGFNFRPTELQAEFGRIQLYKFSSTLRARLQNAKMFWQEMASIEKIEPLSIASWPIVPSWFALPIVLKEGISRKSVTEGLHEYGVDTRPIVGGNLMRHPAFAKYPEMAPSPLPGADAIHDRGFYIGLPPTHEPMAGLLELLKQALH